ncbi:MAG TPA: AAA family ATPase, partial [Thermoplasmata archaeon]|nr:AAA family ATPase [Thermoplasmata archaeon]
MQSPSVEEVLGALSSGRGAIAVVEGEPGIGKTTLVEQALASIPKGPRIVRVRCVPARLSPLYELAEGLGKAGLGMLVAERPPRLEALYLMASSGLLAAKVQRTEGLDADIFSGMLTAVRQFVADSMGTSGLSRLDSDPYKILILAAGSSQLVAIFSGSENEFLRDDLEELTSRISSRHGATLDSWDGTAASLAGLEDDVRALFDSGRYEGLEEAADEPKLKRERLYGNIVRGLRREAQRSGLVLFIDDAQWADEGTVALLQPLGLATLEERLAILMTVRPGEAPEHLVTGIQRLSREAKVVKVELRRRDSGEIGRILESRVAAFDPALVARIRDEGQGNPLYCLEIARYLQEKGMVEPGPQGLRARPDAVFEIPSKARDLIMARVSTLDAGERRTLELAAV